VAEAFVLEALRTARTATMVAGWGNVPGVTIKRFCAPGIDAVAQVAARILADDLELVAAGPGRMNPNGGTIAMGQMGHAFGATGAILLGCLADELERRGGRYGVAVSGTADLGVADLGVADLGVAVLVERVAS
jgi:acetyl-CoA C-acetyltransferase